MKFFPTLIGILFFAILDSARAKTTHTFQCDVKGELAKAAGTRKKSRLPKVEHDSEKYHINFDGLYDDFEMSVQALCDYTKKCRSADDQAAFRNVYAHTPTGAYPAQLREKFNYTNVDYYLFDDHELNNLGNVQVTDTVKIDTRTYYLNGDQVVAILEKVGSEGVLTRYDSKCRIQEVVSLSSLTSMDNFVRLKVTEKFCNMARVAQADAQKETQTTGAFFLTPDDTEDQMEGQELCKIWAAPKPVEGLEITASARKTSSKPARSAKTRSKSSSSKRKKKSASSQP